MRRIGTLFLVPFFLVVAGTLHACGDPDQVVGQKSATLLPVRGEITVDDAVASRLMRLAAGQTVHAADAALGRLTLDSGPRLLLGDEASLSLEEGGSVGQERGRVFFAVAEGDSLEVTVSEVQLRLSDASASVRVEGAGSTLYVVRGEVAYSKGEERGLVRAGERLTIAEGQLAVSPETLWEDWTGGLARPGPNATEVEGVGLLEARVPDEHGKARWPLVVRRLDVRVRVVDDLAVTEVDQVFFNPASETVEGLYRFRAPTGAVLQRFSVDREGRLVDGYVRERAQAQRAYQEQVYRGSTDDPALLEWDAPGSYRARIYPIAAGETRRIVVRYAEWLSRPAEGAPRIYRYPLGSGVEVQEFALEADLSEAKADRISAGMEAEIEGMHVSVRRSDFRPRADFWLELGSPEGGSGPHAYRAAHQPPLRAPGSRAVVNEADEREYWYLPLVLPEADFELPEAGGVDVVVVVDVSAATDRSHLELGHTVVESLARHLGPEDRVAIVTSDLTIRTVGEGGSEPALVNTTEEGLEQALDALARVPAGGATDLGESLAVAASLLDSKRKGAVIYVGDGAPTVGELRAEGLLEHLGRLPSPLRLYAVGVGGDANLELLSAITRGGGLALRVEERSQAAEASFALLAHIQRPLAQGVTVDLGSGIENAFPRRPVDVVLGDILPIAGRIRDEVPSTVTVRGTVLGEPFEKQVLLDTLVASDETDLRLRWAGERLRQLLLEGASREEVAELGTRYGLITPFTSYYVPSARELGQSGHSSLLVDRPLLRVAARDPWAGAASVALGVLLAPLTLGGCMSMSSEDPGEPAAEYLVGSSEPEQSADKTTEPAPVQARPLAEDEAGADREASGEGGERNQAEEQRADDSVAAPAPPAGSMAEVGDLPMDEPLADLDPGDGFAQPTESAAAGLRDSPRRARLRKQPSNDRGSLMGLMGTIGAGAGGSGSGYGRASGSTTRSLAARPENRGGMPAVVTTTTTTWVGLAHRPSRCSDAADRLLDTRRALWRERLSKQESVRGWVEVYRQAIHQCEARSSRDRRALLTLILNRARSVQTMVRVYHSMTGSSARSWLRGAILRRVRSAEDLRIVRDAMGLSNVVDWELVQRLIDNAPTVVARIRVLRGLLEQNPTSFELKLRLLEELERGGRTAEARRWAARLRVDPLADAGVRTAIGEMYLRLGDESEARRAFSEIVEFAPLDELARRRLGDLYRAHGWFEDAYRQYYTLSEIRPDDPSVLLLLAQAAAGVGRIDEALRLERRLSETAEPGQSMGVARTALLWSSVRYAKLRQAAQEANDQERLEALLSRMRAGGVLRETGQLRASLTWSHPDAQLSLWAAHPGLGLSRPTDISPEYGIEAFDVGEVESGGYRFEVRRAKPGKGRAHLTVVTAELVLIWNEGQADEKIEIVPLRFEGDSLALAWTLEGRTLAEAQPSREATQGGE